MQKYFARLGNSLSILCAIHCLAMPMLIGLLPVLGAKILMNHTFELVLMFGAVLCTVVSLCWGYQSHGHFRAFAFLFGGVLWITFAVIVDTHHAWMSFVGGGCLCAANIVNRMLCKSCNHCKTCDHH